MNKQPVSFLQTDPRWGSLDYSAKGEKTTIRASGCGPTAMAMVLATWADPSVDPKTECAWALAHGYKAPRQGTYYGYFEPAGARYGLEVDRLNWTNIYGRATSPHHETVKEAIERGDLVIACMGKGNWTSSGHYVLVWDIRGETIYINDPASTKAHRVRGDYALFKKQVKYYWVVKRPEHRKEEDDMTIEDVKKYINSLSNEEAYELMMKAMRHAATLPEPDWSKQEGHWAKAKQTGLVDGTGPERPVKRDEFIAVLGRLGLLD